MNKFLIFVVPALLTIILLTPFMWLFAKKEEHCGTKFKKSIKINLILFFGILGMFILLSAKNAFAASTDPNVIPFDAGIDAQIRLTKSIPIISQMTIGAGIAYFGAAISTGLSSLGAGIAVAAAAPAAIGACSEDPKAMGKSLVFIALGEGVALYGLIISVLIIGALGK